MSGNIKKYSKKTLMTNSDETFFIETHKTYLLINTIFSILKGNDVIQDSIKN
jgi:hypothetical protein